MWLQEQPTLSRPVQKGVPLEGVFIQVRVSGGKGRCGQELGLVPLSWSAEVQSCCLADWHDWFLTQGHFSSSRLQLNGTLQSRDKLSWSRSPGAPKQFRFCPPRVLVRVRVLEGTMSSRPKPDSHPPPFHTHYPPLPFYSSLALDSGRGRLSLSSL